VSSADVAHYWGHPAVPGVDLMRARYGRHSFTRHAHETFAVGVVQDGAEELLIGDEVHRVVAGGVVMINPEVVHTGRPVSDGQMVYRVFYLDVAVVAEATGVGNPWFGGPVAYDAAAAAALDRAHRVAESGDRLAAADLLTVALRVLWQGYGDRRPVADRPADRHAVLGARDILHARIADPPALRELAAEVGADQFGLVRAFRATFGLPPHAYLNQQRVRHACALLREGRPPAEVAVAVGFADQSHLSRHFRRIMGLPPGRYQRKNVQDRHRRRT
jgi:AraC-like DNA-binding protein